MTDQPRGLLVLIKAAFKDFGEDECAVRAAALAYYTVFALPPLLILLIIVAGMVWDPAEIERALETQFAGMMGESGARQIHTIITQADRPGSGGLVATLASVGGLLFGATGAFLQLQGALNRAWEVKPDPREGGVMQFITRRMLSLGMVLGIAFLLAVSLALTSAITAMSGMLGGGLPEPALHVANFALSFVVLGVLFAAMYKVLPDAEVAWRDVWVGGAVTALLFVAGKFAIGFYLGRSSPGDAFGAAGALAVVLVWAYYSGMILLFGAEFTQQWARRRGSGIRPSDGAVRVIEAERHIRPGKPGSEAGSDAGAEKRSGRDRRVASVRESPGEATSGNGRNPGIGQALLGVPIFLWLTRGRSGK